MIYICFQGKLSTKEKSLKTNKRKEMEENLHRVGLSVQNLKREGDKKIGSKRLLLNILNGCNQFPNPNPRDYSDTPPINTFSLCKAPKTAGWVP